MPTNVCVCVVHIRTKTKVDDKDHKSDYIINSHMPKENILEISKAQAQPKQQTRMTNNFLTPLTVDHRHQQKQSCKPNIIISDQIALNATTDVLLKIGFYPVCIFTFNTHAHTHSTLQTVTPQNVYLLQYYFILSSPTHALKHIYYHILCIILTETMTRILL